MIALTEQRQESFEALLQRKYPHLLHLHQHSLQLEKLQTYWKLKQIERERSVVFPFFMQEEMNRLFS